LNAIPIDETVFSDHHGLLKTGFAEFIAGVIALRKKQETNSNEKGDGCVDLEMRLGMAKMRARRAPFTDHREGRLKRQVRRAFLLFDKPLTTTELAKHSVPCGLSFAIADLILMSLERRDHPAG
jgi:hypothetical protein